MNDSITSVMGTILLRCQDALYIVVAPLEDLEPVIVIRCQEKAGNSLEKHCPGT